MTRSNQVERLVQQFADSVIQQTESLRRQDSRTGNKYARRRGAVFDKLRAIGDPGREALASLFTHERDDVRAMAAAFLLRYKTQEARDVLQNVATTGKGLAAFGAEQAIKRWEEGDWSLDPP